MDEVTERFFNKRRFTELTTTKLRDDDIYVLDTVNSRIIIIRLNEIPDPILKKIIDS